MKAANKLASQTGIALRTHTPLPSSIPEGPNRTVADNGNGDGAILAVTSAIGVGVGEKTILQSAAFLTSVGTAIANSHAAVKGAAEQVLLAAARCGLLLLAAKQMSPRGDFESWFETQSFGFSKVTRCKYMRFAARLCEEAKSKPGLLLLCHKDDGKAVAFNFDEERLGEVIKQVCSNQTLSDLYVQWNITPPPKANEDSESKAGNNGEGGQGAPEKSYRSCLEFVDAVPKLFSRLGAVKQAQLITSIEALLSELRKAAKRGAK
jgi:hypothetical protein